MFRWAEWGSGRSGLRGCAGELFLEPCNDGFEIGGIGARRGFGWHVAGGDAEEDFVPFVAIVKKSGWGIQGFEVEAARRAFAVMAGVTVGGYEWANDLVKVGLGRGKSGGEAEREKETQAFDRPGSHGAILINGESERGSRRGSSFIDHSGRGGPLKMKRNDFAIAWRTVR
jgi:hypothetical protein